MAQEEYGKKRSWIVVINNPTESDIESFKNIDCEYKCFNLEHDKGDGTPHVQGYIHFENARHFNSIKKMIQRAHIEPAKGNIEANRRYCGKEGNLFEFGKIPCERKKSEKKTRTVKESVEMSNEEIRTEWPDKADRLIHNRNKLDESKRPRFNKMKRVVYITGKSGSGKTRLAHEIAGEEADIIDYKNNFLNGYTNESKNVIWDEFRDNTCQLSEFLKITDKYSNRINTKNGDVLFYTNLLVITSIKHPSTLYPRCGEDAQSQISRRIELVDLDIGKELIREPGSEYEFMGDSDGSGDSLVIK